MGEHLTAAQRDQLLAELAELEGPRRKAIVEAIATARAHGDLSENFEYHAAKNEQGLLERRITILRHRLQHAEVIDEEAARRYWPSGDAIGARISIDNPDAWREIVGIVASVRHDALDQPPRGTIYFPLAQRPTSTIFAVLHTGRGRAFRLWTLFGVAGGLVFGGLVLWRGNLVSAILAHFFVNAVNLIRLASRSVDSGRLPGSRDQPER